VQYVFSQKVLFKFCDPAGIVFFPRYFEMINDCVEGFFDEAIGFPFEKLLEIGGVPTAEISTRFRAPSRHGDMLTISLGSERLGRSSLGLSIVGTCDGETRFESTSTLVFVDRSGKPTRWPEAVRDKLNAYVKGPQQ
jgi:4-hydroxybenzoyl-CoA thioesterase